MRKEQKPTDSMESRLRAERPFHAAPDSLPRRVMSHLPPRRPDDRVETAPLWPRFALAFASVAALAVASFHFFRDPPAERNFESEIAPRLVEVSPSTAPLGSILELPPLRGEEVRALATRLDDPLERELENVISDTRVAIQFVASNFLPEK